MSKWSEEFNNHEIHETIRDTLAWVQTEFDHTSDELEIERRRLTKILDMIASAIKGLEPEFFPVDELTDLNNHLRQPNFYNQLDGYSKNGNLQHLRKANAHMSGQASRIYQLAANARPADSRKVIKDMEEAFDRFASTIQTSQQEFQTVLDKYATEISTLKQHGEEIDGAFNSLKAETEEAFNEWSTEHTQAQNDRSTEFSNSEIQRTKKFEASQDAIETTAKDRQERVFKELAERIGTLEKTSAERADAILSDMDDKHRSILRLHDIVAGDGVAGGYKKTAKDEGDAANLWRNIAMWSFGAASLWTLVKVVAYWKGWVSTIPGSFDWPEVIATSSLTIILLATAAYAARQSKLHRINEQRMSWFSLEVGALDPFIASLSPEQQQVLKIELSQRLFGQKHTSQEPDQGSDHNALIKTLLDAVSNLTGRGG